MTFYEDYRPRKETQQEVYCLFSGLGGEEFGTGAKFKHKLVPQNAGFPE